MDQQAIKAESKAELSPLAWSLLLAGVVYAALVVDGARLLGDPDIYWHIVSGGWILKHHAFPHEDAYSFTFAGHPWIAKEWLSQVLYAIAHTQFGWSGVVVLAVVAIAIAIGLLTRFLLEELPLFPAIALTLCALLLAAPHMVARPHVLALPLLVAWMHGLVRAADEGRRPRWALLALMVAWANLHAGFTLGLAFILPLGAEAVWKAADRKRAALGWLGFLALAIVAACITPYGPHSIWMTYKVLDLGPALQIIQEWKPQDFSHLGAFETLLLLGAGLVFWRGVTLPPIRILILLGLVHLALAHTRDAELLGLIGPLILAAPLRQHLAGGRTVMHGEAAGSMQNWVVAGLVFAVMIGATWVTALRAPSPPARISPVAAVARLKSLGAKRVFNDYGFGGYLIYAGVPTFIDGRTELYGGDFMLRQDDAVNLRDLPELLRLLKAYGIDATILAPDRPAVALLDRLPGWRRVYTGRYAVVHMRVRQGSAGPAVKP
jgi:hypothetical protein